MVEISNKIIKNRGFVVVIKTSDGGLYFSTILLNSSASLTL